jgi:hypothetical protein
MKHTFAKVNSARILTEILVGILLVMIVNSAQAQGEFTQCNAISRGVNWNIVNGFPNQSVCYALSKQCTGDPNVVSHYYYNAVLIQAPYTRCGQYYQAPQAPAPRPAPPKNSGRPCGFFIGGWCLSH